jgi:hypothetical protein
MQSIKWLLLLITSIGFAQCPNIGFESNNFSGWVGSRGSCCPIVMTNAGIVANRHTITSGIATDTNTCNVVPIVAPGSTHSARLGNNDVNAEAEGLSYNFTVTPTSNLITYQYAVVFEDPGHTAVQQPRFEASIVRANGTVVSCTQFIATAASGLAGFQSCNKFDALGYPIVVRYKNWSTISADVSAYMGQTLTLRFRTGDCSQGGHFGYAYVDASCGPLQLAIDYCVNDMYAVVTAPSGFFTYLWSTGETTQTIYVNPLQAITVSCTITTVSGCTSVVSVPITPVANFPAIYTN